MNIKNTNQKSKILNSRLSFWILIFGFCILSMGCEAFARKFTRKPKEIIKEEPLFEPQAYPDVKATSASLYEDSFLFWEGWAEELVSFLNEGANFKKQRSCAQEALDNLVKMRSLLSEKKAEQLDAFIADFTKVRDDIFKDNLSNSDFILLREKIYRTKAGLRKNFVFSKIEKDLK